MSRTVPTLPRACLKIMLGDELCTSYDRTVCVCVCLGGVNVGHMSKRVNSCVSCNAPCIHRAGIGSILGTEPFKGPSPCLLCEDSDVILSSNGTRTHGLCTHPRRCEVP